MKYIEIPAEYAQESTGECGLFIAGGITRCPDWQSELVKLLKNENIAIFNPRRSNFPTDIDISEEQIGWEHRYLRRAMAISFWFPKETICPIVLYELGAWSMTKKKIFVGIHPEYSRRKDVEIQTRLVRPDVNIVYDLHSLSVQIRDFVTNFQYP